MLGVVNPTLESMRIKASYVNDLSGAAVLSNVVMPSNEDPFRSVVVKWMELDIPFQSTGLVQNRDYVRDNTKVYSERNFGSSRVGPQIPGASSDLPSLLCFGTAVGDLDDMMFGVINPTLEAMRIKASYVDDISGAAVLSTITEPSMEEPFKSLVVKWMEFDLPFQSMGLVRNRDYIYVEATNIVHLSNGEKVGYHILHSVNFPETHDLPGRVRANTSICGIFRQVRPNACEIYVTGLMDPGGDMIRKLVVPNMATAFLSTLKYAHCGQMKKLAWMLEKRYTEAKELGTPNRELICVTCASPITGRKLGDFGKSDSTCKLCFGHACHNCKISKKLSFVTPDLLLARRKVTFCAVCVNEAMKAPAAEAARAQIVATGGGGSKSIPYPSNASTASSISESSMY
ncbi:Dolichyldiphosphatase 1 [Phytophthora nicotianae]|uniref:Dolichyldiphosphatase 1 n=1 Tax=Phytophthora nicotianae TaxID=4792 RepID=A0A0W8DCZ7_PHYNI|nr:Dolichyldiphosphatase 1 [Phytophthora nicotianae]